MANLQEEKKIILASSSKSRIEMLQNAGVKFTSIVAAIDERQLEDSFLKNGGSFSTLALHLARAKAKTVSIQNESCYVIGSDQVLICQDKLLHKVRDYSGAREQLKKLRGEYHILRSAASCYLDGKNVWDGESSAHLTMRNFSDSYIDSYIEEAGDALLQSVGCYQIEGIGIQLFSDIQGDMFTIMGFPLMAFLKFLREKELLLK